MLKNIGKRLIKRHYLLSLAGLAVREGARWSVGFLILFLRGLEYLKITHYYSIYIYIDTAIIEELTHYKIHNLTVFMTNH